MAAKGRPKKVKTPAEASVPYEDLSYLPKERKKVIRPRKLVKVRCSGQGCDVTEEVDQSEVPGMDSEFSDLQSRWYCSECLRKSHG